MILYFFEIFARQIRYLVDENPLTSSCRRILSFNKIHIDGEIL